VSGTKIFNPKSPKFILPTHQSSLLFLKIAEVKATKSKDHGSITNFSLVKLAACGRFQAYHFLTKFTKSHISNDFSP
jgi:hypothetical protein